MIKAFQAANNVTRIAYSTTCKMATKNPKITVIGISFLAVYSLYYSGAFNLTTCSPRKWSWLGEKCTPTLLGSMIEKLRSEISTVIYEFNATMNRKIPIELFYIVILIARYGHRFEILHPENYR